MLIKLITSTFATIPKLKNSNFIVFRTQIRKNKTKMPWFVIPPPLPHNFRTAVLMPCTPGDTHANNKKVDLRRIFPSEMLSSFLRKRLFARRRRARAQRPHGLDRKATRRRLELSSTTELLLRVTMPWKPLPSGETGCRVRCRRLRCPRRHHRRLTLRRNVLAVRGTKTRSQPPMMLMT